MLAIVPDCELFQRKVYGPVPPAGVAVAVPLLCPQFDGVAPVVKVISVGCPTTAVVVEEHPFASVVVTVYVPGESEAGVMLPVPPEGDHK